MFEDISKLSSSDPKIGKAAALNILHHVQQNKTELGYLVKRLISGLESTKIQTRTGCYTALSVLLQLEKVEGADLFDLMQKALITNKQSTKKERRLIYIARILCCGSILRGVNAAALSKQDGLVKNILHEIVDLSLKKSSYFQLATPFLTHLLVDSTLTKEVFDEIWPEISVVFESLGGDGKRGRRREEEEDQDEGDEVNAVNFGCCVQLALCCRNGGFVDEFSCLGDVGKIVKALLVCRLQFEDVFLKSLFKSIKESRSDVELFWTTMLENVKPTQFDLLCLSVEVAVEERMPLSCVISKRLLSLLLGVFKTKDTAFHARSVSTIKLLLDWNEKDGSSRLSKKERKSALKCLFGGEAPNILHEYKKLNTIVRSYLFRLKGKELEVLRNVLVENLGDDKIGVRMGIVYLNVLGRICCCSKVLDETFVEIVGKLVRIGVGKESVDIKGKDGEEFNAEEVQGQLRGCARDAVRSVMASVYNIQGVERVWGVISAEVKELSENGETLRLFKDVKKVLKKISDQHLRYLLIGYSLRVLIDEKEVLSGALEGVRELIELSGGEEIDVEIVRFLIGRVVREVSPCVYVEGLFSRLIIEKRVGEGVVSELAAGVDLDVGDGEEEGSDEDEDSEGEDEDLEDEPAPKKTRLDPEQIAKLKEAFGGDEGSDSEESIALEDATAEDLQKMDGALAKVFAIKKVAKDEDNASLRGLMRTLRLIDMYVVRSIKCMSVSSVLILLMPVVNCLKGSLKMKKFGDLTTRVIGVLDNLCRVKRFSGAEEVAEGTLGSVAEDLYGVGRERRFKVLREVIEHCVLMVLRVFLGGGRFKKDSVKFRDVLCRAVDDAGVKLKRRRRRKVKGGGGLETSRFVRLALEVIGDGWGEGRSAVLDRVDKLNR